MTQTPEQTPEEVQEYWSRRRTKEHLALVGFIHVFLLVAAATAFFAGGDPGRAIAAPLLVFLATFTSVDLIRTGARVIRESHQARP